MRVAAIIALVLLIGGCGGGGSTTSPPADSPSPSTTWPAYPGPATNPPTEEAYTPEPVTYRLKDAKTLCKVLKRSKGVSGNRTFLGVDTQNEYDTKGIKTVGCVLGALDTPKYVIKMMNGTTALMGVQKIKVDGLKYRWTYHPENVFDLIIIDTEVS